MDLKRQDGSTGSSGPGTLFARANKAVASYLLSNDSYDVVLLNADLTVIEHHGSILPPLTPGAAISEALPFTAGYDALFQDIQQKTLPALHLPDLSLSYGGLQDRYLSLDVIADPALDTITGPATACLILIIRDSTPASTLRQQAMQQRNELILSRRQLETQYEALKASEAALTKAKAEAEQANRAKSAFVAAISHEVRTPMQAIVGMLDLLADGDIGDMRARQAKIARAAALDLTQIVNDILEVGRIESGHFQITPTVGNLAEEIRSIVELLRPAADGKSLAIHLELDDTIDCSVRVDHLRFRQILRNLIANAIKFTDHGHVRISAIVKPGGAAPVLQLSVRDTGSGISSELAESLFEPYTQESNRQNSAGTGLGLSICRSLATALGGAIGHSPLPQGSHFWVEIPVRPVETIPAVLPEMSGHQVRISESRSILLIEDNETIRETVQSMLREDEFTVTTAASATEGLRFLMQHDVSSILVDIHMPVMSGLETLAAIRALAPPKNRTPVIAFTGDNSIEKPETWQQLGFDGFLGKPVRKAILIDVLRSCHADSNAGSVLDLPRLMHFGDDIGQENLSDMIAMYIRDMQNLNQVIQSSDTPVAERIRSAHSLRSCAATIGAFALEASAADLEQHPTTDCHILQELNSLTEETISVLAVHQNFARRIYPAPPPTS